MYWLGSPYNFSSAGSNANEFRVYNDGSIDVYDVSYTNYGARPVVSLSSKAKLSGNGTYNDVYTVS